MNTATSPRPPVRAAFEGLIDYAGLFPPARLSMEAAVAEYDAQRKGAAAWMLGRFIVPASRLAELAACREPKDDAIGLTVILDASSDPRKWFASLQNALAVVARRREDSPSLRIEALEVPLAPLAAARETFDAPVGQLSALVARSGMPALPVYAELPPGAAAAGQLAGAMAAIARARINAKVRCGGVTREAVPPAADIATFVATAAEAGVAWKATAGLHHPVHHTDSASGATMHGFLNLLGAATFAPRVTADVLARIVAEEDAGAFTFDETTFAWRDERADLNAVKTMRETAFVSYGSCSFREPVEDLTSLRLLPAGG